MLLIVYIRKALSKAIHLRHFDVYHSASFLSDKAETHQVEDHKYYHDGQLQAVKRGATSHRVIHKEFKAKEPDGNVHQDPYGKEDHCYREANSVLAILSIKDTLTMSVDAERVS